MLLLFMRTVSKNNFPPLNTHSFLHWSKQCLHQVSYSNRSLLKKCFNTQRCLFLKSKNAFSSKLLRSGLIGCSFGCSVHHICFKGNLADVHINIVIFLGMFVVVIQYDCGNQSIGIMIALHHSIPLLFQTFNSSHLLFD